MISNEMRRHSSGSRHKESTLLIASVVGSETDMPSPRFDHRPFGWNNLPEVSCVDIVIGRSGIVLRFHLGLTVALIIAGVRAAPAATAPPGSPEARQEAQRLANMPPVVPKAQIDHSGRKQTGRASYYAGKFQNRKMADGNRFDPKSDAAASKTLPLGTTAKVTNVQNGRSAMVKVQDRGPHVAARVLDVTPKAADQLDMKKTGVAPVVVAPVAVPQADGTVKLGAGAAEIGPDQLQAAAREARAISR
jgi:rare lipoprotein A